MYKTEPGHWNEIKVPFAQFKPKSGAEVAGGRKFNSNNIHSFEFSRVAKSENPPVTPDKLFGQSIAGNVNYNENNFSLQIKEVAAYGDRIQATRKRISNWIFGSLFLVGLLMSKPIEKWRWFVSIKHAKADSILVAAN